MLLVAVAGRQLYLVKCHALTPWLGGGMGMFATTDRMESRISRAILVADQGREYVVDQPSLQRESLLALRARILPTDERLAALGKALSKRAWCGDRSGLHAMPLGDDAPPARPLNDTACQLNHTAVRIEVWRVTFDSQKRSATTRLIRQHTYMGRGTHENDSMPTMIAPQQKSP